MGRIWSDENRFRTWLAVEVAATETLAEAGIVPKAAAKAIRERADFKVERIQEIESAVRHDVIAFTTAVAEIVGPHARWFHYGLTSNDVVDTAQALLVGQASEMIADDLEQLAEVLKNRAWELYGMPTEKPHWRIPAPSNKLIPASPRCSKLLGLSSRAIRISNRSTWGAQSR